MPAAGRIDDCALDDAEALDRADPGGLLRLLAGAGAQVRAAARHAEEAGVRRVAADGRPRAVVTVGLGASGQAGDVLAAAVGAGARVPLVRLTGPVLPGWVGPMDLVLAVCGAGATAEVLAVVDEAVRRGCRLLTVGAAPSPLAARAEQARAVHVPVHAPGVPSRCTLWALSVPLLLAADALGLAAVPDGVLAATADRLDTAARRYAPSRDSYDNLAKTLALELAGTLPVVWGSGEPAVVAAYRFAGQLQANAKVPALPGALPAAGHDQVAVLDGPYAAGWRAADPLGDLFRDRVEEDEATRVRVVLLRDVEEHPLVAARADALPDLAQARGVGVSDLRGEGATAIERIASLVALTDFASVYLALVGGIDPTATPMIDQLTDQLEERTAQ